MAYDIVPGVDENNLFPTPVQAAINKAYREGNNRMQAAVTSGSLNDITRPGVYPIASDTVNDRPVNTYGTLDVSAPTGGRSLQTFTTTEVKPRLFCRFAYQNNWQSWVRLDSVSTVKGLQPHGTDLNTLIEDGTYAIAATSGDVFTQFKNTPVNLPGILEVSRLGIAAVQKYTSLSGDNVNIPKFYTRRINVSGNFYGQWVQTDVQGIEPGKLIVTKKMLLDGLSARKGGAIGLNGKAAIALRFDDAPNEFESIVLPLLQKYALPFTRVTTSSAVYSDPLPDGVFTRMQEYSLNYGGEVWNHGLDHNDLSGYADVQNKIIKPLNDLRAAMPKLSIDCFSSPGDNFAWNGHFPVTSVAAFTDNYTGQTIFGSHAITSGYLDSGLYRPLDGIVRDGLRAFSVDSSDIVYAKNVINKNITEGTGSVFMYHANKVSPSVLEQTFAYIAQKRDEGTLEALTVSGLSFADYGKSYRRNMIKMISSTKFGEQFSELNRRMDLPGATMRLSFKAAVGSYTIIINGFSRTLNSTSGTYHAFFTIPKDATTLSITSTTPYTEAELYFV